MPDELSRHSDTIRSWMPLQGKAARLRARLRVGRLSQDDELFGLVGEGGEITCYAIRSREAPVVDPDMLLIAFQGGSDGELIRDILEDERICLHPLPGSTEKGNRAAELCALLGLRLLGEGLPDRRTGEVELMVGAVTHRAEDEVTGKAEWLAQEDAADNVVSLPSRGYADIASTKLGRGQAAEIHLGGFRGGVTILHDAPGLADAAEFAHQDRFTE